MSTGTINAKKDFPDYLAYFEDDSNLMRYYTHNKVLAFCEPWSPPGISSYIYTQKTALLSENAAYMLGCFDIVDDITLGITQFKTITHNAQASLPKLGSITIPNRWFYDAFTSLPNSLAIIQDNGTIACTNNHW